MEIRQKKQSNQNGKIIYLEILKRRLEAKTNDHGLRVFSCEILPGGVVLMGARLQTLQSFDQKKPYKLWRRSSSFHGRLSFWKRKFNQTLIATQSLHHQTHTHPTTPPSSPSPPLKPHHRSPRKNLQFNTDPHPTTFQPHPPTPSNTTRSGFPTNNLLLKQDLQSDADPHPATFRPHPPAPSNTTPSHLPTNNLPTKLCTTPSRRMDRDDYTHYLIRQALFKSAGKPNPATLHK